MKTARSRRAQAGFTLTEVMVAFAILTIGGLSSLHLLSVMTKSNGHVSAETDALALAARLSSELENAQLFPTFRDPALTAGAHSAPSGTVTTVGDMNIDGTGPAPSPGAGTLNVTYEVRDNVIAGNPRGVDILIVVDNASVRTNETTSNELGRLMRPVRVALRRDFGSSTAVAVGGVLRW
ncbi:MAG: prepilin-type N-terminal cleavage/methylation domain-containing protein [Myxococcota bacterium]